MAVSLSIQGILSNLAGGILILISKPFKVGDYIEAGTTGGTVVDIALVYTKLKTVDNKIIFVPNKDVSSAQITNYTSQELRRVDFTLSVDYAADMELVKKTLLEVIQRQPKSLLTPDPVVRVNDYKESAVEYVVRVWCATDDYWDLRFDLLEQAKKAFDEAGIELTYNHLNVHIIEEGKASKAAE
ncbi:MAG: mechanosensitive ion channel family protein [Oscillospiraceae bacterium]